MGDEDFEVIDVEDYKREKDHEFSHQSLVMMAMRKVVEFGCQEMIAGYYSTDTDNKGKTKVVYKQDVRKAFIESVKTLRMIMVCDFDEDANKKLMPEREDNKKLKEDCESLINKLHYRKLFWIDEEKKEWDKLTEGQKQVLKEKGMGHMEGYFNMNLPYYQQYFLEELDIYREIFEELTQLTSRLGFYKKEKAEA